MTLIGFENGCTGSFVSHWRSPGERCVTLYGTDYRIDIDLDANQASILVGTDRLRAPRSSEDMRFKAGVYLQDLRYLEAVARNGAPPRPLATLEDGLQTLRLAEAILAA